MVPSLTRFFLRKSRLIIVTVYLLISGLVFIGNNSRVLAESLVQGGSNWLNHEGVDIMSSGDGSTNYVTNINNVSTASGYKWQCVELINRLYLIEGWTTSTWSGNGYQMYGNAPSNLFNESQNSMSYLTSGDVLTLSNGGDGHAEIVDTVTKNGTSYNVTFGSQNTASWSYSATLSAGTLTLSGWSGYSVTGITHAPTRMMIIDGSNHSYSEDFVQNSWTTQMNSTNVSSIAVGGSGRMMALTSSGAVYSKDYPTANWVTQISSGAKAIAVGGKGRMMVIDSSDNAYAKDGSSDSWTQETTLGGIVKIAVGGNGRQMIIDNSNNSYSEDSLGNNWGNQATGITAISVGGNGRMMVINSANNIYAKDGLTDSWTQETTLGGYIKIAVGGNGRQMMIDTSNTAYYEDVLGNSWNSANATGAIDIAVGSNGRLMFTNNSHAAYGENKPTDGWTRLTSDGGAYKIAANIQ